SMAARASLLSGPGKCIIKRLDDQRIARRPAVPVAGEQAAPGAVAPRHEPEAVVLDLVNPALAGRGLVGGGWKAGFDEARPVRGQALPQTLDQHAPNLGGRRQESNRWMPRNPYCGRRQRWHRTDQRRP